MKDQSVQSVSQSVPTHELRGVPFTRWEVTSEWWFFFLERENRHNFGKCVWLGWKKATEKTLEQRNWRAAVCFLSACWCMCCKHLAALQLQDNYTGAFETWKTSVIDHNKSLWQTDIIYDWFKGKRAETVWHYNNLFDSILKRHMANSGIF